MLLRVARWFCPDLAEREEECDDIILVRGTFGSGKSHLLACVLTLIAHLGARITVSAAGVATTGCRALVSSNTNVAVDRILMQLAQSRISQQPEVMHKNPDDADMDIEFMRPLRLARVGQLARIDKAMRPYIVHTADNPEAVKKEITTLLETCGGVASLTGVNAGCEEKAVLEELLALSQRVEWAQEQERRLAEAEVVGVTCASSMSPHLAQSFDVLVLDEASQMTESLRAACQLAALCLDVCL